MNFFCAKHLVSQGYTKTVLHKRGIEQIVHITVIENPFVRRQRANEALGSIVHCYGDLCILIVF